MRLMVVVVAACSGTPTKKIDPPTPPIAATVDAGVVSADAALAVATPPAEYALPQEVVDRLAKETVSGNVLVPSWTTLYQTLADARVPRVQLVEGYDRPQKLHALRVIKDHGDVIEVSTVRGQDGKPLDCEESFARPYVVTVFVGRDKLVMRSTVPQSATYPDGTAVTIDAGAPVVVTPKGLMWRKPLFAGTQLRPREDQLAFSGPAAPAITALAPMPGEQLFCNEETPKTQAEGVKVGKGEKLFGCGAINPPDVSSDRQSLPPPTLNGSPVPWDHFSDRTFRVHRQADKRVLADVESTCGRIRIAIEPGAASSGGMDLSVAGYVGKYWVPAKGPVTWEDGTPAGEWVGTEPIETPQKLPAKKPTRLCVTPRPFVNALCHSMKGAKQREATVPMYDNYY